MKNRDKLNGMAIYDLLCRMVENLYEADTNICIVETITGANEICRGRTCQDCIAAWLNEEAEDNVD